MDLDQLAMLIAAVLMAAHIGVFVWSGILRKGIVPVVALDLVISGTIVLDWARRIDDLLGSIELVWVWLGFELVVVITSIVALTRLGVPRALPWIAFGVHWLLVAGALYLMFTFKITRLI